MGAVTRTVPVLMIAPDAGGRGGATHARRSGPADKTRAAVERNQRQGTQAPQAGAVYSLAGEGALFRGELRGRQRHRMRLGEPHRAVIDGAEAQRDEIERVVLVEPPRLG